MGTEITSGFPLFMNWEGRGKGGEEVCIWERDNKYT